MKRLLGSLLRLRTGGSGSEAVLYGFLWRGWQLLATPVTLVLVARLFSPELQGFYYTFASLIALQVFVELGFQVVIINVAAHEWAHLSLDAAGRVVGDATPLRRLASLRDLVTWWYGAASAIFVLFAIPIGLWFFHDSAAGGPSWVWPWVALVAAAALNLWAVPFVGLLEACGQIAQVHRFGLVQSVAASVAGWIAMAAGARLWVLVIVTVTQALTAAYFLFISNGAFFRSLPWRAGGERVSWRQEVWPMQWRLACSGLVTYFGLSLFNPVMFWYHGPVVAGQMGMTLQILAGVQMAAGIWLKVKVPAFGMLVARNEFAQLHALWRQTTLRSLGSYVLFSGAFLAVAAAVAHYRPDLGSRILPISIVALFVVAGAVMNVAQCMTAYLRSHKEEPIMVMSVVVNLLIGSLVWLLGRPFGPVGAALGNLAAMIVLIMWETQIWQQYRERLRSTVAPPFGAGALTEQSL